MDSDAKTEAQACYEVGTLQFPTQCGGCGPKDKPPTPQSKPTTMAKLPGVIHCGKPATCTGYVLNTMAAGYTCLARITWLMQVKQMNETSACSLVAATEYPKECGACNPHA